MTSNFAIFPSTKPPGQAAGVMEMGGGSTQIAFVPTVPLYAGEYKVGISPSGKLSFDCQKLPKT